MSEEVTHEEGSEIKDPKAVLAALERAKADAKHYRTQYEATLTERDSLKGRVTELEGEITNDKWKSKYKEAEVRKALSTKGVKDVDRLLKFVELDGVDFDAESNLTGLDEAVKKVQKDLPELFDNKRRVGGAADLFSNGDVKEELSTTEQQLRRLRAHA